MSSIRWSLAQKVGSREHPPAARYGAHQLRISSPNISPHAHWAAARLPAPGASHEAPKQAYSAHSRRRGNQRPYDRTPTMRVQDGFAGANGKAAQRESLAQAKRWVKRYAGRVTALDEPISIFGSAEAQIGEVPFAMARDEAGKGTSHFGPKVPSVLRINTRVDKGRFFCRETNAYSAELSQWARVA